MTDFLEEFLAQLHNQEQGGWHNMNDIINETEEN